MGQTKKLSSTDHFCIVRVYTYTQWLPHGRIPTNFKKMRQSCYTHTHSNRNGRWKNRNDQFGNRREVNFIYRILERARVLYR